MIDAVRQFYQNFEIQLSKIGIVRYRQTQISKDTNRHQYQIKDTNTKIRQYQKTLS